MQDSHVLDENHAALKSMQHVLDYAVLDLVAASNQAADL